MRKQTLSWREGENKRNKVGMAQFRLLELSETKRNKVGMAQFRLLKPLKTILTHKETCEKFASFACFFMV
jgi:hypothetical protein